MLVCYCSRECQRADWKEGHKHACKQLPIEKQIVKELFDLEVKFLLGLSNRSKKKLLRPEEYKYRKEMFPVQHYTVAGKIALVLTNVSPCCVVHDRQWSQYATRFYEEVARPWFAKHEAFFMERGFELRILPPDAVPHIDIMYMVTNLQISYGSGLLFTDRTSGEAALVDRVFNRVGNEMTTRKELHSCFGLPPPNGDPRKLRLGMVGYMYQEPLPEHIFKIPPKDTCCASCLEYFATDSSAVEVGEHFRQCQAALNRLGFSLTLDIPVQNVWSDEGLAAAWLAAGGRDYDTTMYFLRGERKLIHCRKERDLERPKRIAGIMRKMTEVSSTGGVVASRDDVLAEDESSTNS